MKKNNTKNLWTGYLLRSFLFVFLLLGVLSFGIPKAKAEFTLTDDFFEINGSVITITEDIPDNVMICADTKYYNYAGNLNFAVGSATSTPLNWVQAWSDDSSGLYLSYIFNVPVGNSSWSINRSPYKCYLIGGVDTDYPIVDYVTGPFSYRTDFVASTTHEQDFFIFDSVRDGSPYTFASSTIEIPLGFYSNYSASTGGIHLLEANSVAPQNYTSACSGNCHVGFTYLDITPKSNPSNDYIIYYGDNPKYVKTTEVSEYPVVYNICDSWVSTSTYYAELYDDTGEGVVLADEVLSACSGTIELSSLPFGYEFSNSVNVRILDYTNSVVITESDPFLLAVYGVPSDSDNWIKFAFDNPYYVPVNSATTTLDFTYRIYYEGLASSTLCFKNILNNAKTNYCADSIVEGLATTSVDVPPSSSELFVSLEAVLYDVNNNEILSSDPFMLSYYSATTTGSFTGDVEDMNTAFCANLEEGFTRDVCNGITFWTSGIMEFITRTLKSFFPISLMTDISTSWRLSAGGTMPEEMAFLPSANSNNDLEIELPSSWVGSASSSFVIWGNSFFKDIPKMSFFFEGVRYITTILLWVGLVFYFVWLGKRSLAIIKE